MSWGGLLFKLFIIFVALPLVGVALLIALPKKVPDRWEIRLFLLMGMPGGQFLSFIIKNGVDPVFWHRALYATYISLMNGFFWIPEEERRFPTADIEKTEIKHAPIFIVGHYRSGTSLLHELMNRDERFLAPNVFQCYTPRIFLGREDYMSKKFSALKITRPMDKMKVGLDSAFEDEFALANLSGLSPYLGAIFPRQYAYYERYLTFRDCDADEIASWKRTVLLFFKKVLLRHPDQRLILKSPSHTARVKLLRELFPKAKFIHISRNPYEIYQSTHKLHEKLLLQWNLQRPPLEDHDWRCHIILNHFRKMYEAYFEDIQALKPEDIIDVRYTDLVKAPTATIERIYTQLKLGGFDKVRPVLMEYEEQQKGFKVGDYKDLAPREKAAVAECWKRYFEYYDYKK